MSGGKINDPVKDATVSLITAAIVLLGAALVLAPVAWVVVRAWRWALGA